MEDENSFGVFKGHKLEAYIKENRIIYQQRTVIEKFDIISFGGIFAK
jgi:hypothetical protein